MSEVNYFPALPTLPIPSVFIDEETCGITPDHPFCHITAETKEDRPEAYAMGMQTLLDIPDEAFAKLWEPVQRFDDEINAITHRDRFQINVAVPLLGMHYLRVRVASLERRMCALESRARNQGQEITKLREEIIKLRYAPHGFEMEKAKKHFEAAAQTLSISSA